MDWPYEIAERDHEIQNPTSAGKILLLGEYLGLTAESHVLDIACGNGGPASLLAAVHGCRITGVEIRPQFAAAARERLAAADLDGLVEIHTADAASFPIEPESFDAALCLGAAFVWGTIGDAAAALVPVVPRGGFVAVGEPFWRQWPPPDGARTEDYVSLDRTVGRFEEVGVALTGLIASSDDDWDRYESLHWLAIEEWLSEQPDEELRALNVQRRARYLRSERGLLGWAIFVGRKG
jgi:SAM-dependent methyltransferase